MAAAGSLSPGPATVSAQGPDGYAIHHVTPACAGIDPPCYTAVQDAVDGIVDIQTTAPDSAADRIAPHPAHHPIPGRFSALCPPSREL